jgi:hypothetical protein
MRWRFTWSASHYFLPKSSFAILKFSITKAGGAAIAAGDSTSLAAVRGTGYAMATLQVGLSIFP